ncbi:MAG: hypothetical protein O7G85_05390, partial [Planctomycetota bacterium]|nr:hypothetical protein [Planctomycetota bacterium]
MQDLFEQFDEAQLLAFVEGELDPKQQRTLLTRLESNPQAKKAILLMCDDRESMRSIADPELPCDFMAQIEPWLARPMLLETSPAKPGEMRRKQRRALRQKQWPRMAAAAVLLLVLSGGIWASSGLIMDGLTWVAGNTPETDTPDSQIDSRDRRVVDDSTVVAMEDQIQALIEEGGVLHHHGPEVVSLDLYAFADLNEVDETQVIESAEEAMAPLPSLALFIEADHEALVEKTLRDLIPDLQAQMAIVRNYSPRLSEPANVVFRRPTINTNARTTKRFQVVPNEHIARSDADRIYQPMKLGESDGDSSLCPSRKTQTRYADMGASHTLSVRQSHLNDI